LAEREFIFQKKVIYFGKSKVKRHDELVVGSVQGRAVTRASTTKTTPKIILGRNTSS
jgi:hypothetical protein